MVEKVVELTADEVLSLQLHEALGDGPTSEYNQEYKQKLEQSPTFQSASEKVQEKNN